MKTSMEVKMVRSWNSQLRTGMVRDVPRRLGMAMIEKNFAEKSEAQVALEEKLREEAKELREGGKKKKAKKKK